MPQNSSSTDLVADSRLKKASKMERLLNFYKRYTLPREYGVFGHIEFNFVAEHIGSRAYLQLHTDLSRVPGSPVYIGFRGQWFTST